jgi:hypothetical protein
MAGESFHTTYALAYILNKLMLPSSYIMLSISVIFMVGKIEIAHICRSVLLFT